MVRPRAGVRAAGGGGGVPPPWGRGHRQGRHRGAGEINDLLLQ